MMAPHHNFVAIALMLMKFGTDMKLDVIYTIALLCNYDILTCILADVKASILNSRNSQALFVDLAEILYLEVFWVLVSDIESDFTSGNF